MYIKDLTTGKVRPYGANRHDALRISSDGRTLSYQHLQNGDGSLYGDYRFTDDEGRVPAEDDTLVRYGADAYFNIGGFKEDCTNTELGEVIRGMLSDNYKERFKAEYQQLSYRASKLEQMIEKLRKGELDFTPTCSEQILQTQLDVMQTYKGVLELRAEIEEIEI